MTLSNPVQGAVLQKWPQGNITQLFGVNHVWYYPPFEGHPGIDIAMPFRTPELSCFNGKVLAVLNNPAGYGKYIKIISEKQPDGFYYIAYYGHCDEIIVKAGDKITEGQTISYMGNTGFVITTDNQGQTVKFWGNAPAGKGVHLHWGIMKAIDAIPNSHQEVYQSGDAFTIPEYNNGFQGFIDPLLFLTKENMMTDSTLLRKLYLLAFHREPDPEAMGYLGKDSNFVVDQLLASEENQVYDALYKAGKQIEQFGYENGHNS